MLKLILVSLTLIAGWMLFSRGYWENVPVLDRISGPMRFRQYVEDPIPEFISDIQGGYSGSPQGVIVTEFAIAIDPAEWSVLSRWSVGSEKATHKFEFYTPTLRPSAVYEQKDEVLCRHTCYLAINRSTKRGALIVP